jgi:hypothetical protein
MTANRKRSGIPARSQIRIADLLLEFCRRQNSITLMRKERYVRGKMILPVLLRLWAEGGDSGGRAVQPHPFGYTAQVGVRRV